ncbi:MAG TPA: hypothetical protein DF774_05195 [Rheinheimera sp.]|nr:hypothetical protein [Rheinheimera sp.]
MFWLKQQKGEASKTAAATHNLTLPLPAAVCRALLLTAAAQKTLAQSCCLCSLQQLRFKQNCCNFQQWIKKHRLKQRAHQQFIVSFAGF